MRNMTSKVEVQDPSEDQVDTREILRMM